MAIMWKRRLTVLRFLLAIVIAYLPLQSISAQSCCQDEVAARHADDVSAADQHADGHHKTWDCCSCCTIHGQCGDGEDCPSSACAHATQFIPVLTFDAFISSALHPPTRPPGLHEDCAPELKTKPPKYPFT